MERGAFGLVIRLSRCAGMAPFESRFGHRLAKILTVLYVCILVAFSCIRTVSYIQEIITTRITLLPGLQVLNVSYELILVAIIAVGGFSSMQRMKRMVRVIKQLEETKEQISCCRVVSEAGKSKYRILNVNFGLYVLGYAVFSVVYQINHWYNYKAPLTSYVIYWIQHYSISTLEMQLAALAGRVLMTLDTVNEKLQELCPHRSLSNTETVDEPPLRPKIVWEEENTDITLENNINSETVQINEREEIEYKIRRLATSYMKICEIVEESTEADGLLMIGILVYHMLHLEGLVFDFITQCNTFINGGGDFTLLLILCYIIIDVGALVLFIEPFHRVLTQMERTLVLVQNIKVEYSAREAATNELELFQRMLILRRSAYSPLDMFTLSRSLLVKIFGSLVTYLVINLTYGAEKTFDQ